MNSIMIFLIVGFICGLGLIFFGYLDEWLEPLIVGGWIVVMCFMIGIVMINRSVKENVYEYPVGDVIMFPDGKTITNKGSYKMIESFNAYGESLGFKIERMTNGN